MGLAKAFSDTCDYQEVMYNGCFSWRRSCLSPVKEAGCFQVQSIPLKYRQCILCNTWLVDDVLYFILFCIRSTYVDETQLTQHTIIYFLSEKEIPVNSDIYHHYIPQQHVFII